MGLMELDVFSAWLGRIVGRAGSSSRDEKSPELSLGALGDVSRNLRGAG
jgi:hypothetical protein